MNEQQQMVPFKGFIHSSPGAETCESDCPSLIKSHHSISEDAHVSQSSETLTTAQTIQDVHHVKLFGQSLFLQTDSCNQQPNTKVTPTSPPALISGRSQTDDTHTKVSWTHTTSEFVVYAICQWWFDWRVGASASRND